MEDSFHPALSPKSDALPPKSYFTILSRRKWLILKIAVVVLVLTTIGGLMQPKQYRATTWLVASTPLNATGQSAAALLVQPQSDLTQHIQLMARPDMAEKAKKKAGAHYSIKHMLDDVNVAENNNVLIFSYADRDPATAQKIADAWSKAYVQDSLDRNTATTVAAIHYVKAQVAELEGKEKDPEQRIVAIERAHLDSGVGLAGGAAGLATVAAVALIAQNYVDQAAANASLQQAELDYRALPKTVVQVQQEPTATATTLETQVATLKAKAEQMRNDYYEDSPELKELNGQIARLQAQLTAHSTGLTKPVKTTSFNPESEKAQDDALTLRVLLKGLQAKDGMLRKVLNKQRALAATVPAANMEFMELTRKIMALDAAHTILVQRMFDLQLQKTTLEPAVKLVKPAELPTTPSAPQMKLVVGLGLAGGLLLGLLIAVVVDQLEDTFATIEEVDHALQQRLVGIIPRCASCVATGLTLEESHRSPFSNAVRMLASIVRIEMERQHLTSLAVTSAGRGEGKSIIAANVAAALAKSGHRVLLVDANLHQPKLHELLGESNEIGLTNLLLGESSAEQVIQRTRVEGLSFVGSGPLPPSSVDLLASELGAKVAAQLNQSAEFVIWDTPSASRLADATVIGHATDRTLFIVGANGKRAIVRDTLRNLLGSGITMIGLVANQFHQAEPAAEAGVTEAGNVKKASA